MPDFSILLGSPRLDIAAAGGPSVKKRPPDDDPDAIRRIQHALVELGFPLPKSFPGGASGEPDGLFGPETFNRSEEHSSELLSLKRNSYAALCLKTTPHH